MFRFDSDGLQELQAAIPTDLQLLRLRLRFGVPGTVEVGQRFRVVVDLVDEMGQPVPESFGLPEGLDIHVARSHTESSFLDDNKLVLKIEEKLSSKQRTKWLSYATLASRQGCLLPRGGVHVLLMIQMKQTLHESSATHDNRHLLQDFCAGSAWLNEQALVLPLQVKLHVTRASAEPDTVVTSTACTRLFRSLEKNNDSGLIMIEENYGDAMGSHVWDASIVLSFLVQQAATTDLVPSHEKLAILELGAGCGLLATVLAKRQSPSTTAVFTEKAECTERLQRNLHRNDASTTALVLPLEWGAPLPSALGNAGVQVVFAADVLYNWAAHEAFLATLDALAQAQSSSPTFEVFLAHKRRGKASAANLNALATGTFDPAHCEASRGESACRWRRWHVEKLSSLGRVELFRLTVKGR